MKLAIILTLLTCAFALVVIPGAYPSNMNMLVDPAGQAAAFYPIQANIYPYSPTPSPVPDVASFLVPSSFAANLSVNAWVEYRFPGLTPGKSYNLGLNAFIYLRNSPDVTMTVSWNGLTVYTYTNFNGTSTGFFTRYWPGLWQLPDVVATGNDVVRLTYLDPVGNNAQRVNLIYDVAVWDN